MRKIVSIRLARFVLAVSGLLLAQVRAYPCSAFYLSGSPGSVVAKTLDWFEGQGLLFVNKRDVLKRAAFVGGGPAFQWTSRFMSLTLSQTGMDFPWEGMNEAGLSVNVLELAGSAGPPRDDPRPVIDKVQWIQYILDTSGSLQDAMRAAQRVRVEHGTNVHYFVCDAEGACGVFEYLGGDLVIHAGGELPFPALTNDSYLSSMRYFRRQMGAETPSEILSGTSSRSLDRFARAALWSARYPMSGESELQYAFAGLANLAEVAPGLRTVWRMAFVLRDRVAYITTLAAPGLKRVTMDAFDPTCSSGTQVLDINSPLEGNVAGSFRPYAAAVSRALVEASSLLRPDEKARIEAYPETQTRCLENSRE